MTGKPCAFAFAPMPDIVAFGVATLLKAASTGRVSGARATRNARTVGQSERQCLIESFTVTRLPETL